MNRDFVNGLIEEATLLQSQITNHALYDQLATKDAPKRLIYGYIGEMVPWFRGTIGRACERAANTPYGDQKRLWLQWAVEEYGHAELLLNAIDLLGGNSSEWGKTQIYESEALCSYMWHIAYRGTYLDNAAGAFIATEGLLRQTLVRALETLGTQILSQRTLDPTKHCGDVRLAIGSELIF